jgi:hypothetical protein
MFKALAVIAIAVAFLAVVSAKEVSLFSRLHLIAAEEARCRDDFQARDVQCQVQGLSNQHTLPFDVSER